MRYALRPPIAQERLHVLPDSLVRIELRPTSRTPETRPTREPSHFAATRSTSPKHSKVKPFFSNPRTTTGGSSTSTS